jgi:hypothetical protein
MLVFRPAKKRLTVLRLVPTAFARSSRELYAPATTFCEERAVDRREVKPMRVPSEVHDHY